MIKEIILTVFYFYGSNFIPLQNGVPVITPKVMCQRYEKEFGIKCKVHKTFHRKSWGKALFGLDNWQLKHSYRIKAYMERQRGVAGLKAGITPPIWELLKNGTQVPYMGGLAKRCNPRNGWFIVHTMEKRSNGRDGVFLSTLIAEHELGHALGAYHDDELYSGKVTLMHSAATSVISGGEYYSVWLSSQSKREIRQCLKLGY